MFSAAKSAAAGAGAAYQIERSLRFNDDDTAYLNRTFGGPGSTTKFSFSAWVKRGNLSATMALYSANAVDLIRFNSSNQIDIQFNATVGGQVTTTAVFRDPTAWQHILVAVDTTQATAANRVRVYVNGTELTSFATASYPTQNYSLTGFNGAIATFIGRNAASNYYDGYLTEINVVDGTQGTPGNFGETDATTGAWNPIAYSGSYGTNGFELNFSDNSAATAATLGKDYSGNGNNWTPNNFSVTAGAGNDSLTDTPTNYGTGTDTGGVMRGNYCVLNPLDKGSDYTITDAGMTYTTGGSGAHSGLCGTFPLLSGKWYFEATLTTAVRQTVGVMANGAARDVTPNSNANMWAFDCQSADRVGGGAESSPWGVVQSVGNTVCWAVDVTNGKIWAGSVSGGTITWFESGNPATATNPMFTGLAASLKVFINNNASGTACGAQMNFGQRPYAATNGLPSGFLSLCTQNAAEGSITTSGTFTGNASADGPVVSLNGIPTTMTINSNAVTFGTHADKLAEGFKVRTSSGSYNTAGSNSYSVSTTSSKFKYARAQVNP